MNASCHQPQAGQMVPRSVMIMLTGVIILWGINVIMIKYLVHYFPPLALAGIRISIAAAFLMPVSLLRYGLVIPSFKSWLPICGVALSSIFIHQIALSWGLTMTSATHSVLILALNPLLTTLLACQLVKEPLSWNKISGVLVGLSGILLIVVNRMDGTSSSLAGDGVILVATITYVIGSLCVKKGTQSLPPLVVTAYSHMLGAAGLLLAGAFLNHEWMYAGAVNSFSLFCLFFSGMFCTGLATIWWNAAIHRVGASTTALFINGQPVVGVFGSALFLGEHLAWQHFAALLLVILGVSLGTGIADRVVRFSLYKRAAKS